MGMQELINRVKKSIQQEEQKQEKMFDVFDYLKMYNELNMHANTMGVFCEEREVMPVTSSATLEVSRQDNGDASMLILYRNDLDWFYKVIAIAHEMAHASQLILECNGSFDEWNEYILLNGDLLIEMDAWMRAITILNIVEFKDWPRFIMKAAHSYGTYINYFANRQKLTDEWKRETMTEFINNINDEVNRVTGRKISFTTADIYALA